MKHHLIACALALAALPGAWAAGNIDSVAGDARVIGRDGQPRVVARGDRVVEGETLATGSDGELIMLTDDSGVLAVRPLSRVLIEKYDITGTDKDTVSINLLRGALRSITGWIGKTAPRNYRVATATATVGIRGTDHETVIAAEGSEPGTYDRVYSGETSLETAQGSVFLQSGQTGQARARDALPQLLPQAPASLFPARPSDAAIEVLKREAQTRQAERLDARQEQNRRSGGTSARGNPVISAQCTPNSPAQRALDEFIRAYEQGNVSVIQQRLDPALIGYSLLVNDILRDASAQRQTQIRVLDRNMQCGPDVSVIDFSWEKRFIDIATFQPQLQRGRGSVLVSGLGAGINGQWRISGFNGDNPFKTSSTPSDLQVAPAAVSYAGIPGVCTVTGTANLTATKQVQYFVGPSVACVPSTTPGTCSFSSPGILGTVAGAPPIATGTTCMGGGVVTVFVPTTGFGIATFSGAPGSTVVLNATAPASGTNSGVTANTNLQCTATATIPPGAPCVSGPSVVPVNFTVADSARAGQASVPVQVTGANGDRETLQLTPTSPGNFVLTALPVQKGAAARANSGRLEFTGPTSFTVAYRSASGVQTVRSFVITP